MKIEKQEISGPVSLAGWTLTPSIDFITLRMASHEARALEKALIAADPRRQVDEGKRGEVLKEGRHTTTGINVVFSEEAGGTVITVHDPDVRELQRMIDGYPNAWLAEIEFTIDFRPNGEPAGEDKLVPVFRWLSDCVFPPMPKARQKAYVPRTDKYERQYNAEECPNTTRIWDAQRAWSQMRLYIKKDDPNRIVDFPSVRLEATLSSGACQDFGVSRLWQLVDLIPSVRKTLSPYFFVADGIKPKLIRIRNAEGKAGRRDTTLNKRETNKVERAWRYRGAMWAAENGYNVDPHKEANKRIGDALGKLQDGLKSLKLPENSCRPGATVCPQTCVWLEFDDWTPLSPIDVKDSAPEPILPPQHNDRLAK